jgi:hypothetical protein
MDRLPSNIGLAICGLRALLHKTWKGRQSVQIMKAVGNWRKITSKEVVALFQARKGNTVGISRGGAEALPTAPWRHGLQARQHEIRWL